VLIWVSLARQKTHQPTHTLTLVDPHSRKLTRTYILFIFLFRHFPVDELRGTVASAEHQLQVVTSELESERANLAAERTVTSALRAAQSTLEDRCAEAERVTQGLRGRVESERSLADALEKSVVTAHDARREVRG
jgi:hypothetical protein